MERNPEIYYSRYPEKKPNNRTRDEKVHFSF